MLKTKIDHMQVGEEVEIIKKDMVELFLDNLMVLKENYSHLDTELAYDIQNLIAEYEEIY